MKCQDVRRTLSLLVDGQLALTEWAIIQGHLLECAECRKEVDRLHALAGLRARARHRRATLATLATVAVVLAVAVGGAFYVYQGSWPDFAPWSSTPAPPRTAAPTEPVPEPAEPVAPVAAPAPRPAPARPKAAVDATPWGTVASHGRVGPARDAPGGHRRAAHGGPHAHHPGPPARGGECPAGRGGDADPGPLAPRAPQPAVSRELGALGVGLQVLADGFQ